MALWISGGNTSATVAQMHTLPFQGQYTKTCGFGCYSGHLGTDYQLGNPSTAGHPVTASARGQAWLYHEDGPDGAGDYIVLDQVNGHRSRYLHLSGRVVSNGQWVARGEIIGYEGNTGSPWCQNPPQCTVYASPYHLHFEVRHNGTSGQDCCSGTAVDPYASGTFSWKTDPPSTARDLDFSGDGYADVLGRKSNGDLCMLRGNGSGGWIPYTWNPTCHSGTLIGGDWGFFDLILQPGDWNHDGFNDVLGRKPNGDLCLLRGNGAGGWIGYPWNETCHSGTLIGGDWGFFDKVIGPGDINGDGFNDIIGRKPNGELCLLRGNGYSGWIPYTWNTTCHDGTLIGTGWGIFNWLLAPSDWAGNGDSCPDVVARQTSSPYWLKYYAGNCTGGLGAGVNIESAWSIYDWLLTVGDFSGDICSDILVRGGGYLYMRSGNCNGGVTGGFQLIGSDWNFFNWIF